MSLPRREALTSKTPNLMRSKVGQLQGEELRELVLVKGEGLEAVARGPRGLPSVCMTRSWPAYAGK
eukprot:4090807-Pleurochrysis_carterae.AAC.1